MSASCKIAPCAIYLSGELAINSKQIELPVNEPDAAPLSERLANIEKLLIANEIARNNGNLKASYEQLGISRKTLYDKMQKYGLSKSTPEEVESS